MEKMKPFIERTVVTGRDEPLSLDERAKHTWDLINKVERIPEVREALLKRSTTSSIHFERGDSRYGITRLVDTTDGGAIVINTYRVEIVKLKLGDKGEIAKERLVLDDGTDQTENAPKEPMIEHKPSGTEVYFTNNKRALKGASELIEPLL